VDYTVRVVNRGGAALDWLCSTLDDRRPAGFAYVPGKGGAAG